MPLSLTEFASRWKLTLTRATIWTRKGITETGIIRGTKGFIYEDSQEGLAYYSRPEHNWPRRSSGPYFFEPTGYPGEMAAFKTQQILLEEVGIWLWGVPRLSVEEYEERIGA